MFDRLIESGRARPRPPYAALAVSAAANAVVAFAAVTATRAPDPAAPGAVETREALYLFPVPPARVPFEAAGVEWAGGSGPGTIAASVDAASLFAAAAGGDEGTGEGRRGGRRDDGTAVDSVDLVGDPGENPVYVASELDTPVAFDPSSTGPEYPPALQAAGIEGSATMQFVVDTNGTADTTTIKELAVTHPLFALAVRDALTRMRFRPAELGDERVRQLVEQQFNFRIQMAVHDVPNDSTAP